jgi:pimeloyl-ACP methyl ester carboxylesterase
VDTGRYLLRYAAWGSGPPIIFVHGISDVARSFALVAADLSRDFTCILYELPTGAGDRARWSRYRPEHLPADLFALMDHLKLDRTYLLGSSFGSTIALRAAAAKPERFARIVLQGGFARRPISRFEVAVARLGRYFPGQMRHLRISTSLKSRRDGAILDQALAERRAFMRENCGSATIHSVAHIGLIIAQTDLRPHLSKVQLPVRLIGGDSDGIVPIQYEKELLSLLPMVERIEIPNCGHLPQYTHPGLLAELMRQFFTPSCGGAGHDACSAH